ncbi:MAG TPA: hypothetical protein VIF40_15625 [Methylosinus sp.]|jgi:hypothetical protein|uniref:hypothetical protein n=1 Tax=Methylosinus sp. TaxID=427 RepID=UPI002F95D28D
MTIYHRLVAALALAATMLCAAAPVRADTTIYSPSATPILATDWTDLGAEPADVQNLSVGTVYIAGATSKPSSSALGSVLMSSQGRASYSISTHLWARAVDASVTTSAKSPFVAVTSYPGAIVGSAQKITTAATIASGQTVSGAIDLGTAPTLGDRRIFPPPFARFECAEGRSAGLVVERRPLRGMIAAVLQHHPNRPFPNLR